MIMDCRASGETIPLYLAVTLLWSCRRFWCVERYLKRLQYSSVLHRHNHSGRYSCSYQYLNEISTHCCRKVRRRCDCETVQNNIWASTFGLAKTQCPTVFKPAAPSHLKIIKASSQSKESRKIREKLLSRVILYRHMCENESYSKCCSTPCKTTIWQIHRDFFVLHV